MRVHEEVVRNCYNPWRNVDALVSRIMLKRVEGEVKAGSEKSETEESS